MKKEKLLSKKSNRIKHNLIVGIVCLLSISKLWAQCPLLSGQSQSNNTGTSVTLSWNEITSVPDIKYRVRVKLRELADGTIPSNPQWVYLTGENGIPENYITANGLLSGCRYQFQFNTVCGAEQTSFTQRYLFFFMAKVAPSNLTLTSAGITSADLSWSPVEGTNIEYTLAYRLSGSSDSWTLVSDVSTTSVSIPNLQPNTAYEWKVRTEYKADNSNNSSYSAISTFTTEQLVTQGVAINTEEVPPHPSAMLDVSSNNKGILIPRMTETERDAIFLPTEGLLLYQTDGVAGFYYWDSSAWVKL